ncbi:MAG: type II toxin-antitoxin system VapC family toxin [bacterium]|nr:type II toxin-antitoxin system VapC family toxin [bacterium]
MKEFMLDTDICSYIIKERPPGVAAYFRKLKMDQICISVVTYAELIYGVEHSSSKKINRQIVDEFIKHLDVIEWNKAAAEHYGNIRADLKKRGAIIGAMDMMIAAHARSKKAVLVTNNESHFARIKGLKIENWT